MQPGDTWHISEQMQWTTMGIAVLILFCAALGAWVVVKDINRQRDRDAENHMIRVRIWIFTHSMYRTRHWCDAGVGEAMRRRRAQR